MLNNPEWHFIDKSIVGEVKPNIHDAIIVVLW